MGMVLGGVALKSQPMARDGPLEQEGLSPVTVCEMMKVRNRVGGWVRRDKRG